MLRTTHRSLLQIKLPYRSSTHWRVNVENLCKTTTKKDLESHFRKIGYVQYASAHREEEGKGFVCYHRKWMLGLAIDELNNSELHGNILKVIAPAEVVLRSNYSRTHGIKVWKSDSKAFLPNEAIVDHFYQYGNIIIHKTSTPKTDATQYCYILYYEKDAADKARADSNPNINGIKLNVRRDDWTVLDQNIFFLTYREICHDTIKNYFSSFGNILNVKELTIQKKFVGYIVQFSTSEEASIALKESEHVIDSIKVKIHISDTRHAIDIKRKEEYSVVVGPVFSLHIDYDEMKNHFSKFGDIVYVRIPKKTTNPQQYYKILYKDRESVTNVLERTDDHFINGFQLRVFPEDFSCPGKSRNTLMK